MPIFTKANRPINPKLTVLAPLYSAGRQGVPVLQIDAGKRRPWRVGFVPAATRSPVVGYARPSGTTRAPSRTRV